MDIGREDCKVFAAGAEDTPALAKPSATGFAKATDTHVANFLECVRARRRPAAPMALGLQACLVTQMANLSLKRGRRVRWNDESKRTELQL